MRYCSYVPQHASYQGISTMVDAWKPLRKSASRNMSYKYTNISSMYNKEMTIGAVLKQKACQKRVAFFICIWPIYFRASQPTNQSTQLEICPRQEYVAQVYRSHNTRPFLTSSKGNLWYFRDVAQSNACRKLSSLSMLVPLLICLQSWITERTSMEFGTSIKKVIPSSFFFKFVQSIIPTWHAETGSALKN
jgi:hypothetical protein